MPADDVEATFELVTYYRAGACPEQPGAHAARHRDATRSRAGPGWSKRELRSISSIYSTFSEEITTRLREVESEIYQLAGRPVNVNSTRQLATILFEELKLPIGQAHQNWVFRRSAGTREPTNRASVGRVDPGISNARQTAFDLCRRPAVFDSPHDRAGSHLLQPDGRGNRAALIAKSEPAKYSDPDGAWSPRAAGIRRRHSDPNSRSFPTRSLSRSTIPRSSSD